MKYTQVNKLRNIYNGNKTTTYENFTEIKKRNLSQQGPSARPWLTRCQYEITLTQSYKTKSCYIAKQRKDPLVTTTRPVSWHNT